MKPGDYDSIYSDGRVLDAIRDYTWHEDSIFLDLYDYSDAEYDLDSLENYEHLVPANWVIDLVPEDWTIA